MQGVVNSFGLHHSTVQIEAQCSNARRRSRGVVEPRVITEVQRRATSHCASVRTSVSSRFMISWLRGSIVLAAALMLTGCVTQPTDRGATSSERAAEEFRRVLHTCQHVRPQTAEEWHPPAASPEIEQCLARAGWEPDGTLTEHAQFERALHACQKARPKRRGRLANPPAWSWEVRRCLRAKGWEPDGTSVTDNAD